MDNTIKSISEQFSKGNFSAVYPHFHDNISWQVIGSEPVAGKENVIAFCNKMLIEIGSSQLTNTRITADDSSVAIEGYCHYTNAEGKAAEVRYCDVYVFEGDKISSITSYCIDKVIG